MANVLNMSPNERKALQSRLRAVAAGATEAADTLDDETQDVVVVVAMLGMNINGGAASEMLNTALTSSMESQKLVQEYGLDSEYGGDEA